MGVRSLAEGVGRRAGIHPERKSRSCAHPFVLGLRRARPVRRNAAAWLSKDTWARRFMCGLRPCRVNGDRLLRDAIVYLTCLHESGHALGLSHTAVFADIMYSFQFGGDIHEYFGRYRRKLATRDDIAKYSGMSEADRARLIEILKN